MCAPNSNLENMFAPIDNVSLMWYLNTKNQKDFVQKLIR